MIKLKLPALNRIGVMVAAITFTGSVIPAQKLGQGPDGRSAVRESGGESALSTALIRSQTGPIFYTKGGRLQMASSTRSRAYSGGPTQAALEYLREEGLSRFADRRITHSVHQVLELAGTTLLRVRPEAGGIPIRGAGLSFLVSPGNEVLAVLGDVGFRDLILTSDWAVNDAKARAVLKQRFVSVPDDLPLERYYSVVGNRAEPYFEATVVEASGEWSVHISAISGEIERVDSLRWGQAQGYAFNTNPIKGQVAQVQLGNLTSTSNLTGANAKVYSYLPNLLFLSQPKVFQQLAQPVGGNYLYPPSNPRFSEVQLYHGIDRAASRFRDLGFPGFGRPLEGVVLYKDLFQVQGQSVFAGQNNAYFSPIEFSNRGGLFFYLTARNGDVAWDSDVIFHEYTHAVVSALVGRSQGRTFRAINEGTADYFAASFLDDPAMAEWAASIFGSRLPFLRTVDNANFWPGNLVGEEHQDGNIWSGTLWDLRRALGADRANRIALASLGIMDGSAEFFDAALAIAAAAKVLYGDPVSNTAIDVLVKRGVGSDDAATAAQSISLRSGIPSPQRSIPAAPSSQLLGAQQFRIDVPNRAEGLRIQVNASGNVRFFIRYRAPISIQNGQIVYEQFSTNPGTNIGGTLSLDNIPELQAGTYYIGITNTTPQAVTYTVTATVIGGSANIDPATTLLTSGQRAIGSVPAGPFLASRQFAIDVPNGATGLGVTLSGSKDVDLYITAGSPVVLSSQGFPQADFESASDAPNESLTITTRSLPKALQPGRYYIGVLNYSGDTATFSVTATLSSTAPPAIQTQTPAPDTTLIVAAPSYTPSSRVGSLVPQQISFTAPADAISVKITASTQLDVDVIVKKGSTYLPGGLTDYIYTPSNTQPDLEITPDSSPALQPGATYFVAIANYTPSGGVVSLRFTVGRKQAGGGQISSAGIVSAASYQGGGVAPGEIITIFGSGIGPSVLTGLQLVNDRVSTQVAQTRILFDGVPAPIIYVSAGQVSCIAPYSLTSKSSVNVIVEYQGQNSNSVTVPVQASRPALFTANASGSGQGAILNQDNSVNSPSNPADRGSVVVLYATGEGATNPAGVDGQIANSVFPKPLGDVVATIGGIQAEVLYAGAAPGLVAGVFQVNLRVPNTVTSSSTVPLQLRVGSATSRTGVTLAVR